MRVPQRWSGREQTVPEMVTSGDYSSKGAALERGWRFHVFRLKDSEYKCIFHNQCDFFFFLLSPPPPLLVFGKTISWAADPICFETGGRGLGTFQKCFSVVVTKYAL